MLFYYSYLEEVYGVHSHDKENGVLEVELLRKGETETIESDWLLEQIIEGEVDIAKDKRFLHIYEQKFLSDYLPTSS